jgi:hypothetical protein
MTKLHGKYRREDSRTAKLCCECVLDLALQSHFSEHRQNPPASIEAARGHLDWHGVQHAQLATSARNALLVDAARKEERRAVILCHSIGYPEATRWTRRWRTATHHEAVIMATLFPRVGRREAHGPCRAVPCSIRSYTLCRAQQPDESGWTFKDPSWHTSSQCEERRGGDTRALPRLPAGSASFPP